MFVSINPTTNKIEVVNKFTGYILNFLIENEFQYSVMLTGSSFSDCKERALNFLVSTFHTNEIIFVSLQHHKNMVLLNQ